MDARISIIQIDVLAGDVEANRKKALELIEEGGRRKSDFIVLPELWNVGYALDRLSVLAEPSNGETVSMLKGLARKYNAYIIGSIAELRNGKIYNTVPLTAPEGVIGAYSKIHMFKPFSEHEYFSYGDRLGLFKTKIGNIGIAICYDLRFPDLFRYLALGDAKIVFIPAAFPNLLDHWRHLLYARAMENQIFIVATNRIGKHGEFSFFGHSMAINPSGEIIVEAGGNEAILTFDIKIEIIDEARRKVFHLENRKPEVYKKFESIVKY